MILARVQTTLMDCIHRRGVWTAYTVRRGLYAYGILHTKLPPTTVILRCSAWREAKMASIEFWIA